MKVVVSVEAARDLDEIHAWIAKNSPTAAASMIRRLRSRIGFLATESLSYMGRPGKDKGTRELVERPYIIVYEVKERQKRIEVLAVLHAARDR